MARRSAFLRSLMIFAAMFALASCDSSPERNDSPLSPATAPQAGLIGDLLSPVIDLLKPPPPGPYRLIKEPSLLGNLELSKLLSVQGGTISVAGITLTVPSGAVTKPTLFAVLALPTAEIDGSFTALVPQLLGKTLNIGSQGFKKPVTITMSYARATDVGDPRKLVIVYYNYEKNRLEALPSTVDLVKMTVSAQTTHFSKYGMASN